MLAAGEISRRIDGQCINRNRNAGACGCIVALHHCAGSRAAVNCYGARAFLNGLAEGQDKIAADSNTNHTICGAEIDNFRCRRVGEDLNDSTASRAQGSTRALGAGVSVGKCPVDLYWSSCNVRGVAVGDLLQNGIDQILSSAGIERERKHTPGIGGDRTNGGATDHQATSLRKRAKGACTGEVIFGVGGTMTEQSECSATVAPQICKLNIGNMHLAVEHDWCAIFDINLPDIKRIVDYAKRMIKRAVRIEASKSKVSVTINGA